MNPVPPKPSSAKPLRPVRSLVEGLSLPEPAAVLDGVGEAVWIEVIRKMDEVYNDLLQYEVALEEKNAELENSHRFIESVLSSMSDIVVVCDRHGAIQDVNAALLVFVDRPRERLIGRPLSDLCADEVSRWRVNDFFASCDLRKSPLDAPKRPTPDGGTAGRSESGQPRRRAADALGTGAGGHDGELHDIELSFSAAGQVAMPVSLNCTPRRSGTGKFSGLVVTGRPVGELRKAYTALRQAHDDLKRTQQQLLHSEKMASLGRLVAGVAHELNNPISFVLGNVLALRRYAQRLQTYLNELHGESLNAAERAALRRELRIDRIVEDLGPLIDGMIEGAERTRDIVDGLKRFSVNERDSSAGELVGLFEVVERAVRWVVKGGSASTQPQLDVDIDVPAGLAVRGAPGQLQQVVMNLVQNALDATRGRAHPTLRIAATSSAVPAAGGGAGVEAGGQPGRAIDAKRGGDPASPSEDAPRWVVVRFEDNGPGIAAEALDHLFEPFFTTKPVGQGTGLGLSISYGIVERHGGHLAAGNRPSGGAVFILELPAAVDPQR